MFKKIIKKYRKSGSYYRKKLNKRQSYESYLRNHYSSACNSGPSALTPVASVQDNSPDTGKFHTICFNRQIRKICFFSILETITTPESIVEPARLLTGLRQVEATSDKPAPALPCQQSTINCDEFAENEVQEIYKDTRGALQKWAIQYNIRQQALRSLLEIMRTQYGDLSLPSDPRTLLGTPSSSIIKEISGGQYWHQGLENCLRNAFKNLDADLAVQLSINMDGIPIHKSSKSQLWPILCGIHNMPHIRPMAVGIFLGNSKPADVSEYLTPFVDELIALISSGVLINGHMLQITVRCFICDSPARALVKG